MSTNLNIISPSEVINNHCNVNVYCTENLSLNCNLEVVGKIIIKGNIKTITYNLPDFVRDGIEKVTINGDLIIEGQFISNGYDVTDKTGVWLKSTRVKKIKRIKFCL